MTRGSLRLGLFLYQLIFSVFPRETGFWRPWLPSINDQRRQVRILVDSVSLRPHSSGRKAGPRFPGQTRLGEQSLEQVRDLGWTPH